MKLLTQILNNLIRLGIFGALIGVTFWLIQDRARGAETNALINPTISGGIQEIADAIGNSTNWTIVAGAGRGLQGNKNLAFADAVYSLNDNVGLVAGADYLWAKGQDDSANTVKGGITLKAQVHPFKFLGSTFLTNVVCQPFVVEAIATPYGNDNDSVATISTVGVNFDLAKVKNFTFVAGVQYEDRTGAGKYSGQYALIHLGFGRRF